MNQRATLPPSSRDHTDRLGKDGSERRLDPMVRRLAEATQPGGADAWWLSDCATTPGQRPVSCSPWSSVVVLAIIADWWVRMLA